MANQLAYRADVDGLRAVAVLAVIASHLPEHLLPSGFLGVDVFFAISGFVVTGSLMGQRQTRLIPLYVGFLSRRVKRLLPALTLCVAVTSGVVLAADPFPRHSIETGLAALFGFANIVLFFFELDYFSPSSLFNAFTHTWSLGVEEQFYVVFPMFVWLFHFRSGGNTWRPLALAMVAGGLISVSLFAALYGSHRAAAFFLMPMRIWELGIGALVYLATRHGLSPRVQRWLQRSAPAALVVLLACFLAPPNLVMPATVAAVGSAGLLLAAGDRSGAARFLTPRPVVYIGRISYSLYLWHWPIIALGPIVLPAAWRASLLYVAATVVVAVLSYHWVERPLRYRQWTSRRLRDIGVGVAGNAIVATALLSIMAVTHGGPGAGGAALHPPPYLPVRSTGGSHMLTCALDGGSRVFTPDTVDDCTVPPASRSGMPTIWAMGDSHSGHLQGMLYELHDRLGVGVHLVETPGWSFPLPAGRQFEPRLAVWNSIDPRLRAGDIVLISRIFMSRTVPHTIDELRPWFYNVSRLADDLAARGVGLVITGPPPIFPFRDVRECSLEQREHCRLERAAFAPVVADVMAQLTALASNHDNVAVFDLFAVVCPVGQAYCYPDNGSSFLYRDRDHFNSLGSKLLAEPFVDFLRTTGLLRPAS